MNFFKSILLSIILTGILSTPIMAIGGTDGDGSGNGKRRYHGWNVPKPQQISVERQSADNK